MVNTEPASLISLPMNNGEAWHQGFRHHFQKRGSIKRPAKDQDQPRRESLAQQNQQSEQPPPSTMDSTGPPNANETHTEESPHGTRRPLPQHNLPTPPQAEESTLPDEPVIPVKPAPNFQQELNRIDWQTRHKNQAPTSRYPSLQTQEPGQSRTQKKKKLWEKVKEILGPEKGYGR